MKNVVAVVTVMLAVAGGASAGGCASGKSNGAVGAPRSSATCDPGPPAIDEPPQNAKLAPFQGPMVLVQPSTMLERLRAVGLDPKHLPPFDKLERRQLGAVMRTFEDSLGLRCNGCHDVSDYGNRSDFKKPSPRKQATKKMWDDFVRVLTLEDGSPIYCDSCHQGSVQALDRRDKALVSSFMDDVFVGRLKRVDAKDHDCGTCHGDPPDFQFLAGWRKLP